MSFAGINYLAVLIAAAAAWVAGAVWYMALANPWMKAVGTSKEKIDAASDAQLAKWLAADGKLVKRPVLVHGDKVLVGFSELEWQDHFA